MAIRLAYAISPGEGAITNGTDGIQCPVDGCGLTLSTYALRNHLITFHEEDSDVTRRQRKKVIALYYHCPADQCIYNETEPSKHFKNFQQLKQHYMKVHAPRQRCKKCRKPFGLERDLRRHEQTCGTVYKCTECPHSYLTHEALQTHCKRHGHTLPVLAGASGKRVKRMSKPNPIEKQEDTKPNIIIVNVFPNCEGKNSMKTATDKMDKLYMPILPKPLTAVISKSQVIVHQVDTSMSQNMQIQTDSHRISDQHEDASSQISAVHVPRKRRHFTSVATQLMQEKSPVRKRLQINNNQQNQSFETSSTGIQTSVTFPHRRRNRHRAAAGTQTSGDIILKKAMAVAEIPVHNISIGTQASPYASKTLTSSHTQTSEAVSPRRRRKRRTSEKASGSDAQNQFSAEVDEFLKSMLDDLGSSTSTQTSLTFPVQDLNCPSNLDYQSTETQTATSSHLDQQSIETQTPITVFSEESRLSTNTEANTPLNFDNIQLLYQDSQNVSTATQSIDTSTNPSIQQSTCQTIERMFPAIFSMAQINNDSKIPLHTVNTSTNLSVTEIGRHLNRTSTQSVNNSVRGNEAVALRHSGVKFDIGRNSNISNELNFYDIMQSSMKDLSADVYPASRNNCMISNVSDTSNENKKDCLLSGFQSDVEIETDDIITMDTEVQTLASALEFDLLLESVDLQPSMPVANIHTQTVDDVWDMLMTNMETQTTEDLLLPALGFSHIQTQTVLDPDTVNQSTAQTQTGSRLNKMSYIQSSAQTQTFSSRDLLGLNEIGDQTDDQTQTSRVHLIDLDKADTHTQTTFEDLEILLAQFEN